MLKKGLFLMAVIVGIFFMTSCGTNNMKVYNPLSEDEIITYIQNQIYNETGDTVLVNITSKKEFEPISDSIYNIPSGYGKVDDGYLYTVEIINKDNADIIATGTYHDSFIIYDKGFTDEKEILEAYSDNDYREQKGLFLIQSEMVDVLDEKIDNYYIYKDVSNKQGYDIFIQSTNYDDISELLLSFKDIVIKYRNDVYTAYSVYIYKDKTVFNNTDFELYKNGTGNYSWQSYGKDMIEQYTGREVTRIGLSREFNYDLFTSNGASDAETYAKYVDYKSFDYLVFWYVAEPNSFVEPNRPQLEIFGVK